MGDVEHGGAVLFRSDADEEALVIECAVVEGGGLVVMQESDGPLTEWCFEETPHRIETVFSPGGARALSEYFHLDEVRQLPAMLRAGYVGYDAGLRVRELARRLGISYRVIEAPIER